MHKETVSGHQYKTEKIVLDEKDIEFIRTDGAYLTVEELADYFEISHKSFYNVMHRQPAVFTAHQRSKTQKKLQYHKLADDKIFGRVTEGDTSLLIFQLKTRCRMAEVLPESRVEDQIVETPEEREARMEDIRLFTQWKKERLKDINKRDFKDE